ncbi:hypothetical protein BKA61DRAFT_682865 [Leptodontidium sp. MPI-SDFR-AT-0119]|nr:hypothetical protein BKA61DRAFT_682865 [Leptodontidium sp. MPI-SDFR-AT-0119]
MSAKKRIDSWETGDDIGNIVRGEGFIRVAGKSTDESQQERNPSDPESSSATPEDSIKLSTPLSGINRWKRQPHPPATKVKDTAQATRAEESIPRKFEMIEPRSEKLDGTAKVVSFALEKPLWPADVSSRHHSPEVIRPGPSTNLFVLRAGGQNGTRKKEEEEEGTFTVSCAILAMRTKHSSLNHGAQRTLDLSEKIVISGWKGWFLNTLEEAIPQFSSRAVLQLTEGAVTTMLPSVDRDLRGMIFIMEHINVQLQHTEG